MLVSVCMITYGHEKFLKQAIEGVLMQHAKFDIELIISNDNSPDNTDGVMDHYQSFNKPGFTIKYIKQHKNLGVLANFDFALAQCQGAYIAICEGDDFWTDSLKLQKQVDFLEQNKDFASCCHEVEVIDDYGNTVPSDSILLYGDSVRTTRDLFYGNFIPTPSCVYRNFGRVVFPEWLKKTNIADWYLHFSCSRHGKIKILSDKMAVYRLHSGSTWTPLKESNKLSQSVIFLKEINREFDYKFDVHARATIANQLAFILKLKEIGFLSRLRNTADYHCYRSPVGFKGKSVYLVYTFMPRIYNMYQSLKQK